MRSHELPLPVAYADRANTVPNANNVFSFLMLQHEATTNLPAVLRLTSVASDRPFFELENRTKALLHSRQWFSRARRLAILLSGRLLVSSLESALFPLTVMFGSQTYLKVKPTNKLLSILPSLSAILSNASCLSSTSLYFASNRSRSFSLRCPGTCMSLCSGCFLLKAWYAAN